MPLGTFSLLLLALFVINLQVKKLNMAKLRLLVDYICHIDTVLALYVVCFIFIVIVLSMRQFTAPAHRTTHQTATIVNNGIIRGLALFCERHRLQLLADAGCLLV